MQISQAAPTCTFRPSHLAVAWCLHSFSKTLKNGLGVRRYALFVLQLTPRRPPRYAKLNTHSPQRSLADTQLFRCYALFKVKESFYVALIDPATFRLFVTRNKSKSVQALAKRQDSGLFPSVAQSVSHSAKRTFPATLSSFRSLASLLELTLRSPAAPREVLFEVFRSRFAVDAFLTASDLPCSCVLRKDDGS